MARSVAVMLGALLTVQICLGPVQRGEGEGTLDAVLRNRAAAGTGRSQVIVQAIDAAAAEHAIARAGGRTGRRLMAGRVIVADVPNASLAGLARTAGIRSISLDRPMAGALHRTGLTIGSRWVNDTLGFDGTGVGIAIIDSGVVSAHDDLAENRVVHFVDFVDGKPRPHDEYGHGTHVAGIIAGSGHDSSGARRGIAPGVHLVVLRTLDARGDGLISNAIAAIDYAIEQRAAFNIRVINLSVAAGVYESYKTDPLALAAARAVEAGIVVVTAAGNQGRNAKGEPQFGGITAPGNAPWVLTVGASSHNGTIARDDDTVAPFSSLGPSAIDHVAKPDLVAPGVGIESAADAGSTLFAARAAGRIWGTVPTAHEPYFSLSGTSMAAPVVTGAIALMLQANPELKPAAVKAILQSTAEPHADASPLAQGAGFLDARAAVELAQRFAAARKEPKDLVDMWQTAYESTAGRFDPCTTGAGCWPLLAHTIAGAMTPTDETIVWTNRGDGSIRRRQRATTIALPLLRRAEAPE